ncbi:IS3 family transposase [Bacillus sp. SRB1LM]|nr:IS3 family transposase [Bacillus sp. SRB1LM]
MFRYFFRQPVVVPLFFHIDQYLIVVFPEKEKNCYCKLIEEYITFYNQERFQEKLHGLSPMEYCEKAVA